MKKRKFGRGRFRDTEQSDEHMLPIMSLMLILIPFLVGNVAFLKLKSISVSTPGISEDIALQQTKKTRNVIVQMNISLRGYKMDLLDEDTGDTIQSIMVRRNQRGHDQVQSVLARMKIQHPKLSTLLVSVDQVVNYKQLVSILDRAKFPFGAAKLANGKNPPVLNIVLLPKGSV